MGKQISFCVSLCELESCACTNHRQCTGCPRCFICCGMLRIVYNILRGFTEGCLLPPCTKAAPIPKL